MGTPLPLPSHSETLGHGAGLDHLNLTDESPGGQIYSSKLIEERYVDHLAEKRSIEFGHEIFQTLVSTSEIKTGEGGKDSESRVIGGAGRRFPPRL